MHPPLSPYAPSSLPPADKYLSTLRFSLKKLRAIAPDVLLIWRNTWRGHANCADASGPLSSPQAAAASLSPRWSYVTEQNEGTREIIRVSEKRTE